MLKINTLDELKQFKTMSNKHWAADWAFFKTHDFNNVTHETDWIVMINALKRGLTDYMLSSFQSTNDLSFYVPSHQITLVPVPNVKIYLDDSRHWAVSKKRPRAEVFSLALNTGLAKLKQQGTIKKAYRQSGLLSPKVKDWLVLNKQ